MTRVLLCLPDDLRETARIALDGHEALTVLDGEFSSVEAVAQVRELHPDVLVVHHEVGPQSATELARELNHRHPGVGVVLLDDDTSTETLQRAMGVGVRGVVALPLRMSELVEQVRLAGEWSAAVRTRMGEADDEIAAVAGRVIAFAGAKGGVGTSTVAVHTALRLAERDDLRVCLVDLDLQTGDVRALLDLDDRRSIVELVDVAREMTSAQLEDKLFHHASGLRVLLPPHRGEDAELLEATTAGRLLGGVRSRFDVVVLDLGSHMTEVSVVAAELSDDLVVVSTPDVPSVLGANRLVGLWERLQVPVKRAHVLLNRTSRAREVQPSAAARYLTRPLLDTTIPAGFADLEEPTNTGRPDRADDGFRRSVELLVDEVMGDGPATEAAPEEQVEDRLRRRVQADRGALSAEFVGVLPIVLVVVAMAFQMLLVGWTHVVTGHAAREAARELAVGADDDELLAVVRDNLSEPWSGNAIVAPREDDDPTVEVVVQVPTLLPTGLVGGPWKVTAEAGTVLEARSTS